MKDNGLREKIHRAVDGGLSGVEADPFLADRVMAQGKRGGHVRLRTAVIALALALCMTGAAVGAAHVWGLGDFLGWMGADAPSEFATGFDQQLTMTCGDLTFRVRDAFATQDCLAALVEITRTDGGGALFLPYEQLFGADTPLAKVYRDAPQDVTVGAYAAEKGLPIRYANSSFVPESGADAGYGDMWMEGDDTLLYFTTSDYVQVVDGQVVANWTVNMRDDSGAWLSSRRYPNGGSTGASASDP